MIGRQLTYFSAREKDEGRAATWKPAWPSCSAPASPGRMPTMPADPWRQRLRAGICDPASCDARILNIFEGAAEIQAQVIARRLVEGGN
jgi:(2S)-methylsuccinyl-CoA dehydrogenase